jgi:hypothetical protein
MGDLEAATRRKGRMGKTRDVGNLLSKGRLV